MNESNVYTLIFKSNTGRNIRFNIPRANKDLTAAAVRQLMEDIIGTAIISTEDGFPIAVEGAELTTTALSSIIA